MMRRVGIVNAAITECRGRWVEQTYWSLFQEAVRNTLANAKMTGDDVDSVVWGIYNDIFEHQAIPESSLTGLVGMTNKPGVRVTNGGATGFYAMRAAIAEVASGMEDVVLCAGGEKPPDCFDPVSQSPPPMVINPIAYSWDPFFENPLGATANDSYMQMCLGYNDSHPGDIGDPLVRAKIVEKLCRQGNRNPRAHRAPEAKAGEFSERTGERIVWVRGVVAANEAYAVGRGGYYKPLDRIVSDR